MPEVKVFFDTNVLLYLLSEDTVKADRAEDLLTGRGVISVQVLNEFAVVCSRKMGLSWSETKDILGPIRAVCDIEPLSLESHERGIEVAERYGFSFFDAMILASALGAGAMFCIQKTYNTINSLAIVFGCVIHLSHERPSP